MLKRQFWLGSVGPERAVHSSEAAALFAAKSCSPIVAPVVMMNSGLLWGCRRTLLYLSPALPYLQSVSVMRQSFFCSRSLRSELIILESLIQLLMCSRERLECKCDRVHGQ